MALCELKRDSAIERIAKFPRRDGESLHLQHLEIGRAGRRALSISWGGDLVTATGATRPLYLTTPSASASIHS
jgi:hypothetical protein